MRSIVTSIMTLCADPMVLNLPHKNKIAVLCNQFTGIGDFFNTFTVNNFTAIVSYF